MATQTKSFTATGAGLSILVPKGEAFTYSLSGTFVATIILERSSNGGQSWTLIRSATGSDSGTETLDYINTESTLIRYRCDQFTSGTAVTTIADTTGGVVTQEFKDGEGAVRLQVVDGGAKVAGTLKVTGAATHDSTLTQTGAATFTDDVIAKASHLLIKDDSDATKVFKFLASGITTATTRTLTIPDASDTLVGKATADTLTNKTLTAPVINSPVMSRPGQVRLYSSGAKAGATAGWLIAQVLGDNLGLMASMPAAQTAATLIVPINGLRVGDAITAFSLLGRLISAGNAATIDVDLRKMTAAVGGATDASIATMTQVAVTANTLLNASNSNKTLASAETVAAGVTYYLKITSTSGVACGAELQAAAITVTEA